MPGADNPESPPDTLVTIPRRWEPPAMDVIAPKQTLICKTYQDASITVSGAPFVMPFLICEVMTCSGHTPDMIIQWMIPNLSAVEKFGGGKKKKIVDLFGTWRGLASVALEDAIHTKLPGILVPVHIAF